MSHVGEVQLVQGSKQLEISDIELQKPTRAALTTAGKQDDDDAPLLGDKRADEGPVDMAPMPFAAWLLLAAALCAKSSAGAVFEALHDVRPFTAAAWRMQVAALVMLPFAVFQYWRCGPDGRQQAHRSGSRLLASGALLALQWACYAWAIQHTSLPHTLLFLSATPVLLAAWTWLRRQPISAGELLGTALGVMGAGALASGAHSETQVTAIGDVAALLGAAANGASLSIGRNLLQRPTNLPVWIYSAAVTGSAGVVLSFVAIPADGAIMAQAGAHGVFGWASAQYAVLGTYLGIGPGVVGHVGFNVLLLYLSPLVLTLAQTLDPPIGAFVGWAAALMQAPGLSTYLGGAMLLAATVVVIMSANQRVRLASQSAKALPEQDTQTQAVLPTEGTL